MTIWGHSREVKEKEIKQLEFDVRSKEKDVASDEESLRNITTKASQKENEKREMEQEYQVRASSRFFFCSPILSSLSLSSLLQYTYSKLGHSRTNLYFEG